MCECHAPCAQVRCPVGIWNCHRIFPWCMATASPSVVLHDNSRRTKRIPYTRVSIPQQIPLRLNWIWRCCISTHLTFQVSQGSAATDLRWGENFNKFLFCNSSLNIVLKKIRKSVNICQSYQKNKSVSFFMDHSVQPLYDSMDFVRDNPGEPVPEETFTHSHSLWSSIMPICFLHLLRSTASSLCAIYK